MSAPPPLQPSPSLRARILDILKNPEARPSAVRFGYHVSGTYNVNDPESGGGSNGAAIYLHEQRDDPANKGLADDMISRVDQLRLTEPDVSRADVCALFGALAVKDMGGPEIPVRMGRQDYWVDGTAHAKFKGIDVEAPPTASAHLPAASGDAAHLRDVFNRQGFGDRDIVVLSGGHSVGRCHIERSGYDGAWTENPTEFDNSYFTNLVNLTWKPREWDGPLQYTDEETGTLLMLPTDMALLTDPEFRKHVDRYAKDCDAFFADFADAYSRVLELGCPWSSSSTTTVQQ